eukprot:scaffold5517_cov135-Cylindrotheca_fusiformis.AAC.37
MPSRSSTWRQQEEDYPIRGKIEIGFKWKIYARFVVEAQVDAIDISSLSTPTPHGREISFSLSQQFGGCKVSGRETGTSWSLQRPKNLNAAVKTHGTKDRQLVIGLLMIVVTPNNRSEHSKFRKTVQPVALIKPTAEHFWHSMPPVNIVTLQNERFFFLV